MKKYLSLSKIYTSLILVLFFLLPLQTRWIYEPHYLNGFFWEYGSFSWYVIEILIWAIVILFGYQLFKKKTNLEHIFGSVHYEAKKQNLFYAIVFILFLLVEMVKSVNFNLSYNYVFHIIEGVCLFLVVIASQIEKTKLMLSFWGGAIVQALFGIYQFFSQSVFANKWLGLAVQGPAVPGSSVIESGTERWLRAYGSFPSPNILGGYLAVALIIGLVLYLESKPVQKIFYTFGQSIILLGLIFSFSRGAWLSAVVGLLVFGVIIGVRAKEISLSRLHAFSLYIKQIIFYSLIILTSIMLLKPILEVRFKMESRLERRSLDERVGQFTDVNRIIKNRFLTGTGPGTYTLVLAKMKPSLSGYEYQPVHNSILLFLAEWGLVGLVMSGLFFLWILGKAKINYLLFAPVISTVFISSIFDHFWISLFAGQIIFWSIFGTITWSEKG